MAQPDRRAARASTLATVLVAVAAIVGACQNAAPTPAPPTTGASSTGAASTDATSTTSQPGLVILDHGVTVAAGRAMPVVCNGTPPVDQDVAPINLPPVIAAPGTRLKLPNGRWVTLCPGTSYTPVQPENPPAGRDFIRFRVWVENTGILPITAGAVALSLWQIGARVQVERAHLYDAGGVGEPIGSIFPGEVGTFEIVVAVPADGKGYALEATIGSQAEWNVRQGLTAGPPAPVTLPAVSPTVTPKILPEAPAGLAADPGGFVLGTTDTLPHLCNGSAPTKTTSITSVTDLTQRILEPGESFELSGSRVTLCPGVDYRPSPAVYPSGAVTYRQYTAYVSMLGASTGIVGDYLSAVTDRAGHVPASSGRVVDPTQIAYAPRVALRPGQTAKIVFAVAFPSTGGSYFLAINALQPSVYRLS